MGKEPVTFDAVIKLMQNQYRRIVLAVLAAEQQSLTIDDLVESILNYNNHTPSTDCSEDELMEIRFSLHHVHLPKLDSTGLIVYDSDQWLAEPTERLERLESTVSEIIDADPKTESPDVTSSPP